MDRRCYYCPALRNTDGCWVVGRLKNTVEHINAMKHGKEGKFYTMEDRLELMAKPKPKATRPAQWNKSDRGQRDYADKKTDKRKQQVCTPGARVELRWIIVNSY